MRCSSPGIGRAAGLVATVLVLLVCQEALALDIVRDGRALAVIVIPKDTATIHQETAEELRHHVELATGAKLQVVVEGSVPADAPKNRIFVGTTDAAARAGLDPAKLEPEGFFVKTSADAVYLLGRDELEQGSGFSGRNQAGTLMAAYDLLDRNVGVRWLWPGDLGTVVPKTQELSLPEIHRVAKPHFAASIFRGTSHRPWTKDAAGAMSEAATDHYGREENRWLARHHFRETVSLQYGHAFEKYWERFGKTNPEFFQLNPDGSRGPDSRNPGGQGAYVSMCVSNPALHQQIIKDWIERVDYEPGTAWVNGHENDTKGLCLCDVCKSWDGPDPQSVSDRYAKFYLALQREAQKHDPQASVTGLAYANYHLPPQETKLNDRIRIWIVPAVIWPWTDERVQAVSDQWLGWRKAGATLILRPNFTLDGHSMPIYYAEKVGDAMKLAIDNGMVGMDFDSNTGQWSAQGPNLYMLGRLNQRPDLSVKQVLDEYYAAFGPAEQDVREYFAHWESLRRQTAERWTTIQSHWDPSAPNPKARWLDNLPHTFYLGAHTIFTPEVFRRGGEILDAAAARAAGEELARGRVEFLRKGLRHAELTADVSAKFLRSEETGDRTAYLTALRALDAYRRSIEMDLVSNFNHLAYLENFNWDRGLLKIIDEREVIRDLPVTWRFRFDPDRVGEQQEWHRAQRPIHNWSDIRTDQFWEKQPIGQRREQQDGKPYDGVAWYRVTFSIDPAHKGKNLALLFGAIDESAKIYLNDRLIHERRHEQPDDWAKPFTVELRDAVRFDGPNSLTVRVEDTSGGGGIWKPVSVLSSAPTHGDNLGAQAQGKD